MPKLFSLKEIVTVLLACGFILISQKGSHAKFRKNNLTVIVPMSKKEIPLGTFRSILRQANLDIADFLRKK